MAVGDMAMFEGVSGSGVEVSEGSGMDVGGDITVSWMIGGELVGVSTVNGGYMVLPASRVSATTVGRYSVGRGVGKVDFMGALHPQSKINIAPHNQIFTNRSEAIFLRRANQSISLRSKWLF
jgi:hypothetical protein